MQHTPELTVRSVHLEDWGPVVELEAALTGTSKGQYWKQVLERFLRADGCIGLAAATTDRLEGYLFGEVRALEFGSDPCGWVFALGVQPGATRQGVASALLAEVRTRFRAMGVGKVRTMVERNDVPLLSLFRSQGFVGGPYVQLELDIAGPGPAHTGTREE